VEDSFHLDETDRRLLRALQADGSASHAALAEQTGASPASCWRRIRAMETGGVLGPTVRLVNARHVGRDVTVFCHVRLKSQTPESIRAFEKLTAARGEIMECYSMSGEWDFLLRIVVSDVADFERFLMRELLNHPSVATASTHFALRQIKYTTALPI
jgi:Lrp/AsnC family transcriptional regulator